MTLDTLSSGTVIDGRFRILERIGAGGLGVVYSATRLSDHQIVAIKFLHDESPDALRRFDVEARALKKIRHPNCIEILEFGRFGARPFIAMEFLAGVPLSKLRGQQLPVARVQQIMSQVFGAVAHAHQIGVVHRDLKPDNVILLQTPHGDHVKVLDFGLAKLAYEEGPGLTATGEFLGTPQYMSPEQARGERDVGPQTDIYACGVMLFELLMGRLPFSGNEIAVVLAHIGEPPPPVSRTDCPPHISALVRRCLSKKPADRPSARDALAALNGAARTQAAPPTSRHRRFASLALIPVLALAAGAFYFLRNEPPAQMPRVPTVAPTGQQLLKGTEAKPQPAVAVQPQVVLNPGACGSDFPKMEFTALEGTDDYRVRAPKNYDPHRPTPLVVLLSNDRQSVDQMADATGFAELADRENLLLMGAVDRPKKWRPYNGYDEEIRSAVKEVDRSLCLDRDRIFVVGYGSGGGPAMSLRCDRWVRASAMASFTANVGHFSPCPEPRPAIALVPNDSQHVPVNGGVRCGAYASLRAMSHKQFEQSLVSDRGECRTTVRKLTDGECTDYLCDSPLTYCALDGGYRWPGTPAKHPCDHPSPDFPSRETIWKFFEDVSKEPRIVGAGCGMDKEVRRNSRYLTLQHKGQARRAWLALPTQYTAGRPHPVLLAFAPQGQSPEDYVATLQPAAADAGYVVIAPQPAAESGLWATSDLAFVRDLTALVSPELCVDFLRVFGIGESEGADLLRELACDVPLSGIALAGHAATRESCSVLHDTPVLRIAGRDDPVLPRNGGTGCSGRVVLASTEAANALADDLDCEDSAAWAPNPECRLHGCGGGPLVDCEVSGGSVVAAQHSAGCEETEPLDIGFDRRVAPFFGWFGRDR